MTCIVVQFGARRAYAVPEIVARHNQLERFYTDAAPGVGVLGRLAKFASLGIGNSHLRAFRNRIIPDIVRSRTVTFDLHTATYALRSQVFGSSPSKRFKEHVRFSAKIAAAMTKKGFGGASHVYSMLGEGGEFLGAARERGLTVVSEVYILLSTARYIAEERQRYPGWEPCAIDHAELEAEVLGARSFLAQSDWFICPSEAVRNDLTETWRVARGRALVVPYGVGAHWLDLQPDPVCGRVLFVGTAELRKGIHYLAMAAEELQARRRSYEFRIAGNATNTVRAQAAPARLTFLGRVPRHRIAEELRRADVLVLPSLAEGSAEVIYEGLAAGVPVITTNAAGSVVRPGLDGMIVPERNAIALANAIESLIENRPLRMSMAVNARERARAYTWEQYGCRLMEALATTGL